MTTIGRSIRSAAHCFGALTTLGALACTSANDGAGPSSGSGGATAGSSAGGSTSGGAATGGLSTGGASTGGSVGKGGSSSGAGGAVSGGSGGTAGNATAGKFSGGGGKSSGGSDAGKGGAGGAEGGAASTGGSSSTGGSNAGGMAPAAPSTGCGATAAPESGRFSIDVGGMSREYMIAIPEGYDADNPYKLVFGFHPWGGSAQQVAGMGNNNYYGLHGVANDTAIFVAPEGLDFQGQGLGWANPDDRDILFLEAMLDRFRSELCIDENRIFSTGFSFGGMMSWAVACDGLVRAIAPMAGNIQVAGCDDGTTPVAVMGFHGTEDMVVEVEGGQAGRDVFVERNGCSSEAMPMDPSWCDGINQSPCTCVSYPDCDPGYPVIWCEFNADHTPAPNSGQTIWDFFSQF